MEGLLLSLFFILGLAIGVGVVTFYFKRTTSAPTPTPPLLTFMIDNLLPVITMLLGNAGLVDVIKNFLTPVADAAPTPVLAPLLNLMTREGIRKKRVRRNVEAVTAVCPPVGCEDIRPAFVYAPARAVPSPAPAPVPAPALDLALYTVANKSHLSVKIADKIIPVDEVAAVLASNPTLIVSGNELSISKAKTIAHGVIVEFDIIAKKLCVTTDPFWELVIDNKLKEFEFRAVYLEGDFAPVPDVPGYQVICGASHILEPFGSKIPFREASAGKFSGVLSGSKWSVQRNSAIKVTVVIEESH